MLEALGLITFEIRGKIGVRVRKSNLSREAGKPPNLLRFEPPAATAASGGTYG
jgi:hypothetical protein